MAPRKKRDADLRRRVLKLENIKCLEAMITEFEETFGYEFTMDSIEFFIPKEVIWFRFIIIEYRKKLKKQHLDNKIRQFIANKNNNVEQPSANLKTYSSFM